jgi:hypothetical protein
MTHYLSFISYGMGVVHRPGSPFNGQRCFIGRGFIGRDQALRRYVVIERPSVFAPDDLGIRNFYESEIERFYGKSN